jgi:hypothetical protein
VQTWIFSLLLGCGAAVVDTLPMIFKKLDRNFILSAFTFWVTAGILIPRTRLISSDWLNGLALAVLLFLPLLFLILKMDKKALPQIFGTTVLLGSLMGWVSGFLFP